MTKRFGIQRASYVFSIVAFILSMLLIFNSISYADGNQKQIQVSPTKLFTKSEAGKLTLTGSSSSKVIDNTTVYYCDGDEVYFSYEIGDTYKTDNKKIWHFAKGKEKTVNGIELKKAVGKGVIIIQFSDDGKNWYEAADPIYKDFSAKKTSYDSLYVFDSSEINAALYYRVTIGYYVEKVTKEKDGWFSQEEKEVKTAFDEYIFRVGPKNDCVSIHDVSNNSVLKNNSKSQYGFYIDNNYSESEIRIKKDNNASYLATPFQTYSGKGKYTITVNDVFGEEYIYNIEVTEGLVFKSLSPSVYTGDYNEEAKVSGNTVFGQKSLTTLKIAQNSENPFSTGNYGSYSAYGANGTTFKIFLNIWDNLNKASDEWYIVSDTWGKKDKQTIDGIKTELIGTGALIVQTSKDGKTWTNVDLGRYSNGLYTTDFFYYYGDCGDDIEIYTPSGDDISKGVYLRVLYAYKVEKDDKSSTGTRYLEKYEFYVCNDNLGAITIHNLSLSKDELKELLGDADDQSIEVGIHAETLTDGSETVTGFQIDTTYNKAAKITVKKDGEQIGLTQNMSFKDTGKYEISISSPIGTTDHRTIYVDTSDVEQVKARYFGESFITGKRIFEEGLYPVYEGGKTNWNILEVSDSYLPIQGTITNTTTGESVTVEATRTAKGDKITTPGDYQAVFYTNPEYDKNEQSGDIRRFTFNFRIIAEGTAPGPVVNRDSLENLHSKSTLVDYYPVYYGVTYESAGNGNFTYIFKNRQDAVDYAYEIEGGKVEVQDDGTYLYKGDCVLGQKVEYESAWDLTEARYYFAEQIVEELYIDNSDKSKCTVIPKESEKTDNLKREEFNSSVILTNDDAQKELMTELDALPIINDKHYYIQYPNTIGEEDGNKVKIADGDFVSGSEPFVFVQDKYGCDSNSVSITDSEGNVYQIAYGISVDEQLRSYGCKSGIITIDESTIYGDSTSYEAVYIADGDNLAEVTIEYYVNGEKFEKTINRDNTDEEIIAGAFDIKSISDELDPYDLVLVTAPTGEKTPKPFVADQTIKDIWTDEGIYTIRIVNRMGYGFSFSIELTESEISTVSFSGEGTDDLKDMLVVKGQTNVLLPKPEKYGYDFVKYVDQDGNEYTEEIEEVNFDGKMELKTVWEAKRFVITLLNTDGTKLQDMEVRFDSEYELPIPSLADYEEFVCWERQSDGEQIALDYLVQIEGDQTLIPIVNVEELNDYDESEENSDDIVEENETINDEYDSDIDQSGDSSAKPAMGTVHLIIIGVISVFVVTGLIVAVVMIVRSVKNKRKKG